MPIDVAAALSAKPTVQRLQWTERDVLLYHLSIGAGSDPTDLTEQRWVYERDLQVLPTFAMVAGKGISAPSTPNTTALPGIDVPPAKLLHAGQKLVIHCPVAAGDSAIVTTRMTNVLDRGRASVIEMESLAMTASGEPYWTSRTSIWAKDEGGHGKKIASTQTPTVTPDRAPDMVIHRTTRPDQALLYRLNGGRNPLHVDPAFARQAGFERPTMHGLATYGIVCKALVDEILNGDAERVSSFDARFSSYMFPGHSLRISVWKESLTLRFSVTSPQRGDVPVLTHGRMMLS